MPVPRQYRELVEINAALTAERDQLKGELSTTKANLSAAYLQLSTAKNILNGYRAWQSRLAAHEAANPPADN